MPLLPRRSRTHIENFGGNVRFTPVERHTPRHVEDVLQLLDTHKGRQIRVAGSLHAWSDAAATDDVMVDMRQFATIGAAEREGDRVQVTVGGGCPIRHLLTVLRTRDGLTLPTMGTVNAQTVAGAISTATHGSGCSSLSHYVHRITVAAYDGTGRPVIHTWSGGVELSAARCGLGCTGIILSVTLECVPAHHIAERVTIHASLDSALRGEGEYPLQEFALVPFLWKYVVYQRRASVNRGVAPGPLSRTFWYRVYKAIGVDLFFHFLLKVALLPRKIAPGRLGAMSNRMVRFLYRSTPLLVWLGVRLTKGDGVVDRSDLALSRRHDWFTHLEMEVFVPASALADMTALLQSVTGVFAGDATPIPPAVADQLRRADLLRELDRHRGTYTQHYPLYFRRVMPDDTLVSMTADAGEPSYAIGVFCYLTERRRYYEFASFIAVCVVRLYKGRLHWGKYLPMFPQRPLTHADFQAVYPGMTAFRDFCRLVDPNGVFRNEFSRRVLGVDAAAP